MYRIVRFAALLVILLAWFSAPLMAQPIGEPPPCWPPPCIPIDGGLGLLIAAGAILGSSRAISLRRSRKHIS